MNDLAWPLLGNTVVLAVATVAISLPLGSLLGWLLVRTDMPGRRGALVVLGVLLFIPLYLQAAAWQAGFGLQGWSRMVYGLPAWLEGWTGAIAVHALAAMPWAVVITGAGFWLVEPELEEQALLDGTAPQVLWHVTLRRAMPAIGIAAAWIVLITAGEITVTDLFLVRTYAEEVYTRLAMGEGPTKALVGVLPGMVLTAALGAIAIAALARLGPRIRSVTSRPRWVFRLGRRRYPLAVIAALVVVVLAGVPLGNLAYQAGAVVTMSDSGPARSWSAGKLLSMVASSPARYAREFGWSLLLSGLAATAAVVVAVGMAWWARRSRWAAGAVLLLAAGIMAVPGPLIGLAIIGALNRPESPPLVFLYDRSILAPWLALLVRGFPPATLILWHALRTIPGEMLDAASVDGAGPVARLWRIVLPCRLQALGLAWLVAAAVALGDLATSILVVPPGVTTLSIRIFGLLHYGVEDQVAGICLALTAVFAGMAAAAMFLMGRWRSEAGEWGNGEMG